MLEKSSEPQPSNYSFEQLLNWFGQFTPQFKFRMQGLRRQLDQTKFDAFIRETLTVFRSVMIDLAKVPKGPDRARRVFQLIDAEFATQPPLSVTCASGCGACCKSFPKQITDDEADLLASLIQEGQVTIDRQELWRQSVSGQVKSPCLFLDAESRCKVYADRPGVCRKYHVTSSREACESDSATVTPHISLGPELIVSACLSLPDNGFDFMASQLARRVQCDPES